MQRWKKIPSHGTIVEILDIIPSYDIYQEEGGERKRNGQLRFVSTNSSNPLSTCWSRTIWTDRRVIVVMDVKEEVRK